VQTEKESMHLQFSSTVPLLNLSNDLDHSESIGATSVLCPTEEDLGMLMSSMCLVILYWREEREWGRVQRVGFPERGSRL
jgi:hypothetical protein